MDICWQSWTCLAAVANTQNQNSSRDRHSSQLSSSSISQKSRTYPQMHCHETNLTTFILFALGSTMPPHQSQQPSWIFSCCPNHTGHPGVGQNCGTVLSAWSSPHNLKNSWLSSEAVFIILFTPSFSHPFHPQNIV